MLLDLFCGAGGCSVGYHRAGFDVVGVDLYPQPNYPFEFWQADALDVLAMGGVGPWGVVDFDAIHASPPCQAHSTLRHRTRGTYPDLVAQTRDRLAAAGVPYVIENVVGAPLLNPIMLCGTSFGLGTADRELRRHRLFETNTPIMALGCQHSRPVVGVYGTGGGGQMTRGYKALPGEDAEAMGIDWMTRAELAQAIPPAYTEHIGGYLMAALAHRAEAA
jgi:DNA (cytosine-5)-methyltransferase 1